MAEPRAAMDAVVVDDPLNLNGVELSDRQSTFFLSVVKGPSGPSQEQLTGDITDMILDMDFDEAVAACKEEGLPPVGDLETMQEALLVQLGCIEAPSAAAHADTAPSAAKATATAGDGESEYDAYVILINGMDLEEAHDVCEEEGVIPAENTLLSAQAALLAHFVGPASAREVAVPAAATAEENMTIVESSSENSGTTGRPTVGRAFQRNDNVRILKPGINFGKSAVVGKVFDSGIVKVTLDGLTKSYGEKELELVIDGDIEAGDVEAVEMAKVMVKHTSRWKSVSRLTRHAHPKNLTDWRKQKKKEEKAKERRRVQMLFDEIDDDESGELDREEVGQLLENLGGKLKPDVLSSAMQELDKDGDGTVTFDEFLKWWQNIRSDRAGGSQWAAIINMRNRELQEEEELRALFETTDKDGGGTIDAAELGMLTGDLGLALSVPEVQEAMRDIDDDDSGEIDFEEFYDWYRDNKKSKFGLAPEMQAGLKRSMLLKGAKDAMFAALDGEKSTAHLKTMFERLDGDGSGALGFAELYELSTSLALSMGPHEIRQAMKEMDTDGDGEIDFGEFEEWWQGSSAGAAGKFRSKFKLSGYLATVSGSVLTATALTDQDEQSLIESEMYLQDLLSSSFSRTIQMDGKSLGLFSKQHPVRKFCAYVLTFRMTEFFLIACIAINLICIVVADVSIHTGIVTVNLRPINDGINIIFTVEAIMRIIAQSFYGTRHAYLSSQWNIFDFVIISAVWMLWAFALLTDVSDSLAHNSNIVSVLRSFRGLRFFKHIREMLMAINSSIPMLTIIVYGLFILFIVFGVLFHALFNGALTHTCGDEASLARCGPMCGGLKTHCPEALGCQEKGLGCYVLPRVFPAITREDHTDKFGFDNAGQSLMTMFSMATLDDWHAYSNALRTSGGVNSKTTASLGVFIIVVALMAVNFFLAALAFSYIKVRSEARKMEMQRAAEETVAISLLGSEDNTTASQEDEIKGGCYPPVQKLVRNPAFEGTVMAMVMINIFLMAADHHPKSDTFVNTVEICEHLFYVFYLAECVLKLVALGIKGYFSVGLNNLDFVIVVSATVSYLSVIFDSVFPEMKDAYIFRILRMSRLLRAARVAKLIMRSEQIRRMMGRAFSGRAAIASLIFLIAFFLGVAAIIGNSLFAGCERHQAPDNFLSSGSSNELLSEFKVPRPNFNGVVSSFVANFVIFSTDSWTALAFEYMDCTNYAPPYFVVVVIVTYFVLSNLFVAVFFEAFELNDDDKREEQIKGYLQDARSAKSRMTVVDVKARLDSVNDFLGSTRERLGTHVSFNAFIGGIRLSERTAKTAAAFAPGNLGKVITRPANCFMACFIKKPNGDEKKLKILDAHDTIKISNPINDNGLAVADEDTGSLHSDDEETEPKEPTALQKQCVGMLENRVFKYAVISACLINAATIGIDEWKLEEVTVPGVKIGAEALAIAPLGVFAVELILQLVSHGVLLTETAFLASVRGFFECSLLVVATLSHFVDPNLLVWRSMISLRLLYLVNRASVIVQTVGKALPAVWTSIFMIMASFLVFGIIGISTIGGRLWYCEPFAELNKVECIAHDGEWLNRPYHFDNIVEAAKSLFIVWSMQGWTPILFHASDATEVDMAPEHDSNRWPAFAFFSTFMIWNGFMLTKLFVGMLADFFASSSGNLLLTAEQRNWQFMHLFIYHVIKIRTMPLLSFPRACFQCVENIMFKRFIDAVVVLNVTQLVAATAFPDVDNVLKALLAGQWLVIVIYIFEAAIKMVGYGVKNHLRDGKLELFVLTAMVTATAEWHLRRVYGVDSGGAWVFQAMQCSRVLRLVGVLGQHSSRMRKMYYTVSVSFPQCLNLVMAMAVVFSVFSVFGTRLCGNAPKDGSASVLGGHDNFDTSVSSMRVLLQIATGQAFSVMITDCKEYSSHPSLIAPFFFSFFIIGNFIFISLFVALLLDNLDLIASDEFAVSDVDIELWRESWIGSGLRLEQPMNIKNVRDFVRNAKGTFAFIHKADPYWYNRILLELKLPPDAELAAVETVEFFNLLRAVCHIRFSSKCLSLDDEVQKAAWLRDHLQNHAGVVIAVAVRAWLIRRKPSPAMTACGRTVKSAQQWLSAIHCAKVLQLSATIGTQRITPEHGKAPAIRYEYWTFMTMVPAQKKLLIFSSLIPNCGVFSVVSANLDRLQRLVDRRKDRAEVKQLQAANRKAAKESVGMSKVERLAELKAKRAKAKQSKRKNGRSKASQSMVWSHNSDAEAMVVSGDGSVKQTNEQLLETMAWKERNAFLTRRTGFTQNDSADMEAMDQKFAEDAGAEPEPAAGGAS